MFDTDTFLTQLYVMCDDFCHAQLPPCTPHPGPAASLCRSEVLTLALFSAWGRFASQRDFYRFAHQRLRRDFPTLPHRSQFNRLLRAAYPDLLSLFEHLAHLGRTQEKAEPETPLRYEALDSTAVVTRNLKRRGRGWLVEQANIGHSNRVGWFCGLRLLVCVTPRGVITGLALAQASCKDQPLADSFFALRAGQAEPHGETPGVPVGVSVGVPYLADKGFTGAPNHAKWWQCFGALVLCPPQRVRKDDPHPWPKFLRRWHAGLRQIVETVNQKLLETWGLSQERPHTLEGVQVRVLARAALHNWCILLNRQHQRPDLAFADLWNWAS